MVYKTCLSTGSLQVSTVTISLRSFAAIDVSMCMSEATAPSNNSSWLHQMPGAQVQILCAVQVHLVTHPHCISQCPRKLNVAPTIRAVCH
jgi:hypothetical protein